MSVFFFKKDNTRLSCRNGSCNFLWGLNCALWWSWFGSTSTILNANENFHTGHSGLKIRKNLEFLEAFFLSFIKHWSVHFFCHFGAQCSFFRMHFHTKVLTVISKNFSITFSALCWKSTFHISSLHFILGSYTIRWFNFYLQ